MKKLIIFALILVGCAKDDETTVYNIEYPTPVVDEQPPAEPEVPVEEPVCHTKLIGFKNGMTVQDEQALASAKLRCQVYFPDAPCLKKFMKKRHQVYHALCGKAHGSEE
jgi:hypothetical protein